MILCATCGKPDSRLSTLRSVKFVNVDMDWHAVHLAAHTVVEYPAVEDPERREFLWFHGHLLNGWHIVGQADLLADPFQDVFFYERDVALIDVEALETREEVDPDPLGLEQHLCIGLIELDQPGPERYSAV